MSYIISHTFIELILALIVSLLIKWTCSQSSQSQYQKFHGAQRDKQIGVKCL